MKIERNPFIPDKYGTDPDATLDTLADDQHPGHVRKWIGDTGAQTLLIAGPTGTGKTHIAHAIANHYLTETRKEVYGLLAHEMLDAWPERDHKQLRTAKADILIIDAFGADVVDGDYVGSATGDHRLAARDIFDNLAGRAVVTTALTAAQITSAYGADVTSRLAYRAKILILTGRDRRAPGGTTHLW